MLINFFIDKSYKYLLYTTSAVRRFHIISKTKPGQVKCENLTIKSSFSQKNDKKVVNCVFLCVISIIYDFKKWGYGFNNFRSHSKSIKSSKNVQLEAHTTLAFDLPTKKNFFNSTPSFTARLIKQKARVCLPWSPISHVL